MASRIDKNRALSLLLCGLALATGGGCAARQPARSFPDLQQRVKPGQTVFVTDETGSETKGKLLGISATDLTLDVNGVRRPMNSGSIRHVDRYGDSLWNGALIGVAIAIPAMLISDPRYQACTNDPQKLCADAQAGQRALAIGMMGALGAGIDALIRSRHQVYVAAGQPSSAVRRVTISPRFGPSALSLFVTLELSRRASPAYDGAESTTEQRSGRVASASSR